MEIVRLPVGKQAPVDADWIRIEEVAGSAFKLTASALCIGSDDGDSVSIIDGMVFASVAEAEAARMAWATNVGVDCLFLSTGTLRQSLELIEIGKPLSDSTDPQRRTGHKAARERIAKANPFTLGSDNQPSSLHCFLLTLRTSCCVPARTTDMHQRGGSAHGR